MVVQHRRPRLAEEADTADDLVAVLGVQFDHRALLRRERSVLAQQPGGDAEFADVVQDSGEAQDLQPPLGHAQFPGDHRRGPADAFAVPAGVVVLEVHGLHQGADGGLVGGAFAVVLGEDPAREIHRQQDQQRGRRPVRAAPQDRRHQPGRPVHEAGPQGGHEQSAPGGAGRTAFGSDQDGAVECGEYGTEGEGGGRGGQQGGGEVRGTQRAVAEGGGQETGEAAGRAAGQGEFGGVPDASGGGRGLGRGGQRARQGGQRARQGGQCGQRGRQQQGRGQQDGAGPAGAQPLAQRVQGGQGQGVGPGGGGAEPQGGGGAQHRGQCGAADEPSRGRRNCPHRALLPLPRCSQ